MDKYFRYVRKGVAAVVGILCLLAFSGIFYPIKVFDIQFTALLQRVLVDFSLVTAILLLALLVLTLLFGRIYCSTLCPLGLFQELLTEAFRRGGKAQRNLWYKYLLAAAVFGSLIGGTAYFVRLTDPYALFGSACSDAWLGLIAVIVLTVLVWFKGRFFCANICPVGTLLGLISRYSVFQMYMEENQCISCGLCARNCPTGSIDFKNKKIDNETCIKCFRCMGGCRKNGIHFGRKTVEDVPFDSDRRRLLKIGGAVVVAAAAVKFGAEFGKLVSAKIKKVILPAGAGNPEEFYNKCLNCNLCVQNCPMKILKKADGNFGAVHIDYASSFCDYDCHKCSQVCPSGAIRRISLAEKQKTQIGLAKINEDVCVKCGLCVRECPRQAIRKEDGEFPVIDVFGCIGCGACQNVCPVKAITVSAVEMQKII